MAMSKRTKKAAPTAADTAPSPEFCASQDFQALLTKEQVHEFEQHAAQGVGEARRIGLHTLSLTKSAAVARFGEDPLGAGQIWIEIHESIEDYIKHLESAIETMKVASARAFCLAGTALHVATERQGASHG